MNLTNQMLRYLFAIYSWKNCFCFFPHCRCSSNQVLKFRRSLSSQSFHHCLLSLRSVQIIVSTFSIISIISIMSFKPVISLIADRSSSEIILSFLSEKQAFRFHLSHFWLLPIYGVIAKKSFHFLGTHP
jgi:hypothetical protein